MTPYLPELEAALEAARQASRAILAAYTDFVAIPDARADISTLADRQSQEIILGLLHARFPADALCAEEETPTLAAAPRTGRASGSLTRSMARAASRGRTASSRS